MLIKITRNALLREVKVRSCDLSKGWFFLDRGMRMDAVESIQ